METGFINVLTRGLDLIVEAMYASVFFLIVTELVGFHLFYYGLYFQISVIILGLLSQDR